jgi:2-haloalkanoic acid dehalogenase type II
LHHVKAISLDLDDTLWAVAPVIRRAEAELWAWLGEHYPAVVERFTPETAFELRRRAAETFPDKAHDFRFLRKRVLRHMATEAGYPEAVADEAFDVFDTARNRVDLFPDVEPALIELSRRYTLVALTNGNACVNKIGIGRYFAGTISAAETGAAKPARRIFEAAVDHAGADPADILHVGDHPELDVAGAAEAGLKTAWINRRDDEWPSHLAPPDVTVSTMTDLAALLADAVRRVKR